MDGLAMLGWTDFLWRYDEAEASTFCWAGQGTAGSITGGFSLEIRYQGPPGGRRIA